MSESTTALALVETFPPAKLFEPGVIDPILDRIAAEVRAEPKDVSTDSGRKAIASLAYKVARSKTFIDNQRKSLVADEKKRLALIDKEGKRIWDTLESLQREVRQPLTDWEDAEKARTQKHEDGIATLEALASFDHVPTTDELKARIANVEAFAPSAFEEYITRAEIVKAATLRTLQASLAASIKADEERAELERLRAEAAAKAEQERKEREERERKEREEQIAQRAREEEAARARQQQERLEREKRESEEARIRAEERAKAAAEEATRKERERVEREQRLSREAEEKREANKRHVAKVNREAKEALVASGISEEVAVQVVELIAAGKVPNVRIQY